MTRKRPQQLEELTSVPCPEPLTFLWLAFIDLSSTRTYNQMGTPDPIRFSEIESWSRMTRTRLTVWMVDVIKRLDIVYLTQQAKAAKKKS